MIKRKPDRVLQSPDGDIDSYYFHPTRTSRFVWLSEGVGAPTVMFVDRRETVCDVREVESVNDDLMREIEEWVK